MTDRIKLAEAMGWQAYVSEGFVEYDLDKRVYRQESDLPDPYTDANDDYAVLEWMREYRAQHIDFESEGGFLKWVEFSRVLSICRDKANILPHPAVDYRIGDYARAALEVIE